MTESFVRYLHRMPTIELVDCAPDRIAKARAGDAAAWAALVREQEPALLRLASAILRDRDEARDVCQDAFRQAFTRLAELDPSARFDLWIRRIAINRARDVLRRRGVSTASAGELGSMPESAPAPEEALGLREDRERLHRALQRLPIELREVIVAHLLEDRTYRELAEIFELTVNAVRIRVHRALARLRELMREDV